jgi:uncharacterized membrane protein
MKVRRKVNVRVVVEPDITGWSWIRGDRPKIEELMFKEATRLHAEIRRHVDDSHFASIQYDIENQCSFCGDTSEWGDEEPACCQESLDEFTALLSLNESKEGE